MLDCLPWRLPVTGLVAGLFLFGCGSPEPDTSPVVTITSPVPNMPLPSGQAIQVSFQIGGFDKDPVTGKNVPFTLDPLMNESKQIGKGKVVAYYNGTSVVATAANPGDMTVPDVSQGYPSAMSLILPGSGDLELFLQYGDSTPVQPQRSAMVTVTIYQK